MAKKSDDSLEKFFLNRVDNYNIDYREEDWYKLNEMLDASEAMKAAAFKQKMVWLGSGALLVISVVLLLWMSQNLTSRKAEDIELLTGTEAVEGSSDNNDMNEAAIQPVVEELNKEKSKAIEINENRVNASDSIRKVEEIRKKPSVTKYQGPILTDEISRSRDNLNQKDEIMGLGVASEVTPGPAEEIEASNNVPTSLMKFENITDQKENYGNPMNPLNLRPSYISTDMNAMNEDIITDKVSAASRPLGIQKKYSWNLSLAADYSAVGMSDFDGPSIRAGLSLEYYLSKRLSVLAGVNYSVKTYTALGREYTPPYGFWTNGVVPNETLGECNVLDIPLNLTYYIPNLRGQSFFIRTGLSSWLMLEEHYYYSYDSNDPDLVTYWGGENENYHFFGILNLSAGYEHPINDKFSMLAEPYVNIPLGGVGFGEVNLHSAGLKVTFKINRYKLSISK